LSQSLVAQEGQFPSWSELTKMSKQQRFSLAAELAREDKVAAFINQMIIALRDRMLYDVAIQTKIERCLEAKRQLQFNVNQRLLLETLMLQLN